MKSVVVDITNNVDFLKEQKVERAKSLQLHCPFCVQKVQRRLKRERSQGKMQRNIPWKQLLVCPVCNKRSPSDIQ